MSTFLLSRLAWLDQRRRELVAQKVTYKRGGASVEVLATIARGTVVAMNANEVAIEAASQDFIIAKGDLVLDGQPITPQAGDVITWQGQDYEVLPDGNASWSPTEPTGTFIRVHTKRK